MNELIKIHEVSNQYDITARTLRYYEDTNKQNITSRLVSKQNPQNKNKTGDIKLLQNYF